MRLRRAAVIAAGLGMATSVGLTGAGVASAAAPALKIKPGATWTFEAKHARCEQEVFQSNGTFVADNDGDAGNWSGGGSTIKMHWTAGADGELELTGHFVSTTTPVEYKGPLKHAGVGIHRAFLVQGAVSSFDGFNC